MDIPFIIGHRGAAAVAPENTLISLERAAQDGAQWVEVDVKLSADNVPYLLHDDLLDRTTNASGPAKNFTWDALKKLDAGSWKDSHYIGEKLARLEDVLDLIFSLNIGINLEIKPCPGREQETAKIVLETAAKLWKKDHPAPLISSFERPCLEVAYQIAPHWPRGYLIDTIPDSDWRNFYPTIAPTTINIDQSVQTQQTLKEFSQAGKPLLAYTCNDVERAKFLKENGVRAIFTDNPALFRNMD